MNERAEVQSIQAIADFRNALLIYISKVRPLLDDSIEEVARTRDWLRVERRAYWENKVRQTARELAEAQQSLFSAELARLRAPSTSETLAVSNAKRALAMAEEKLRLVKRLSAEFEREAMPRVKQVEKLRLMTGVELLKGVRHLEALLQALDRYRTVGPTSIETNVPETNPGGENQS